MGLEGQTGLNYVGQHEEFVLSVTLAGLCTSQGSRGAGRIWRRVRKVAEIGEGYGLDFSIPRAVDVVARGPGQSSPGKKALDGASCHFLKGSRSWKHVKGTCQKLPGHKAPVRCFPLFSVHCGLGHPVFISLATSLHPDPQEKPFWSPRKGCKLRNAHSRSSPVGAARFRRVGPRSRPLLSGSGPG